jgi:predicted GNAT family N-acyltransferase
LKLINIEPKICLVEKAFHESRLTFVHQDIKVYQTLKANEPQLKSIADDHPDYIPDSFSLLLGRESAGTIATFHFRNQARQDKRDLFSRIDIVIVNQNLRGLGIGRVLIAGALLQSWKSFSDSLYSISSLAGHLAVEKVFQNYGFKTEHREGQNFAQCSLDCQQKPEVLLGRFSECLESAIQGSNYRIRQRSA